MALARFLTAMAERYRVVSRHPLRYLLSVPPETGRPGARFPLLCEALELRPVGEDPDGDRPWLDEGLDHVGSATSAYGDERIYRWLLAKTLRPGK